jgi:eukaryotic-like serine/threonine-protein kinase
MTLPSGHLARLAALLDAAMDLGPAEQAAFLDQLSPADQALRDTLAGLLAQAHAAAGDTPDPLPGQLSQWVDHAARDKLRGDPGPATLRTIGPYCLLRLLGEGGMGQVWLAERADGTVQRSVALKLPHPGMGLQPGQLAQRFERERDILAALEHPHIARLYDAGVDTGTDGASQPWLAMELVEGLPLTSWCDQQQLTLVQRVQLFRQVLQAVHYAHSRLVVHRDLKPSNILVTEQGQVRLLDFGVASLLDEGSAPSEQATEWQQAPFTPDYASPEQLLRAPIGTASDIYSLGVLLFELLCGQRPYRLRRDTRGALEEAILDTEPARPSRSITAHSVGLLRAGSVAQLRRQLRGDLDNIVHKALHKQPQDRYLSAEAFEQDLLRWLQHEPVHAHPGSLWYRTGKFLRRHRWPVAAASLASAGLVIGSVLALGQARVAQRETLRTQAVQDFLIGLFNEADPARAQGRELTVRDLMAKGERDLAAKLHDEPELRVALEAALVELYLKLGDGQRALPLALERSALAGQTDGEDSLSLADARLSLGRAQTALGHHEAALDTLARAQAVLARHGEARARQDLEAGMLMAENLEALTRHAEARAELRRLLPLLEARHGPGGWPTLRARVYLATSLAGQGDSAQALARLRELTPLLQQAQPEQALDRPTLLADIGYVQWQARAWDDASRSLRDAVADIDRLVGPRNSLSIQANRTLGMVYLDAGDYRQAAATFADNLQRSVAFHGAQDSETALNLSFQVMALNRLGQAGAAEAAAQAAVDMTRGQHTLSASELRGLRRRLGGALLLAGKPASALALLDPLVAEEVAAGQLDARHAATLAFRAGAFNALGHVQQALADTQASAALWRQAPGPAGRIGLAKVLLTEALVRLQAPVAAGLQAPVPGLIDLAARELALAHAGRPHVDLLYPDLVRAWWAEREGRAGPAPAREIRARMAQVSGAELPADLVFIY